MLASRLLLLTAFAILLTLGRCTPAETQGKVAIADFPILSKGTLVPLEPHIRKDRIVVFDFYADWCAPCKRLDLSLKDLKATYGDRIEVLRLNIENWDSELAKHYAIRDLPYLLVYENGVEILKGPSNQSLPKLIQRLNQS